MLPASGLTGTTYTATPPVAHTVTMETDDGDTEKDSGEPVTRRRRKYSDTPPEEPEEKRQKFLERNRYRMAGNFRGVQIFVDFVCSAYP